MSKPQSPYKRDDKTKDIRRKQHTPEEPLVLDDTMIGPDAADCDDRLQDATSPKVK